MFLSIFLLILSGCQKDNESINVFSESIYKSILSWDKKSIKSRLVKPDEFYGLTDETKDLRSSLKLMQAFSISKHNKKLESYFIKNNGEGFFVKNISTVDLDDFDGKHLKSLVIIVGTPRNDIKISFKEITLIDSQWKIISGYTVEY